MSESLPRKSLLIMPRRNPFNEADEASFALLEPDGTTPQKAKRQQAAATQKKGMVVGVLGCIFLLFVLRPRPEATVTIRPAPTYASPTSSAAASSDDVVVVSTSTPVPKAAAEPAVTKEKLGGDEDVVVVNTKAATAVDPGISSSSSGSKSSFVSFKHETEGTAVVRHVAQGDDQDDATSSPPPPPPPPSSRGMLGWLLNFKAKRAQGSAKASLNVARMIADLELEVKSSKVWAPGEMGLRLAEIERLERDEKDGKQKERDALAKAHLEEHVRAAADKMGDVVSQHLAEVEQLLTEHGPHHKDVLPKVRALESMLYAAASESDQHPSETASQILKVRSMVSKLNAIALRESLAREAASIKFALKDETNKNDLPPPPPATEEEDEEEDDDEDADANDEITRQVEEENAREARKARISTLLRLRRKRLRQRGKTEEEHSNDEEDNDDEEDDEVVAANTPVRRRKSTRRGSS